MDKKYSLIRYLEFSLNRLYNNLNINGTMQYDQVKALKNRIDELKNEILEGVKIRGRLKEQEEGERVSAFLIKQQTNVKVRKLLTSLKTEANVMDNLGPDIVLKNRDSISLYIYNYYKKLYMAESYDEEGQEWFLQFVNKTLTKQDQTLLEKEINQAEIFNA